jgi:hypothetical protein
LLFGGAGALVGLVVGAISSVRRYRAMLGIGCIAAVLTFVIFGALSSGDEKWLWTLTFLVANLVSHAVGLDIGCGMRALLARLKAT